MGSEMCIRDSYYTWFSFTEDFKKYVEEKKTVSGYKGIVKAPYLPFDIDVEGGNLKQAVDIARKLMGSLVVDWGINEKWMRYYFSGKKGFHIIIPASVFHPEPSEDLPSITKLMANEIANKAKVEIDPRIYDIVRLFRIPNTQHKGTNLYKIPLSFDEFRRGDVNQILELAKKPRPMEWPAVDGTSEKLIALYIRCKEKAKHKVTILTSPLVQVERKKRQLPRNEKLCYYKILEGVDEGVRDDCAIRLACFFRDKGMPSDVVTSLLLGWNRRNRPPLEEAIIERKVLQAYENEYSYGCNDPILSQFCQEECYLKSIVGKKVKPLAEWASDYLDYIRSLKERLIHFGFGKLDIAMRGVAPGEVAEVIGLPSVGKSALAINVLKNVSVTQKVPSIFFSLEQPGVQVFERASSVVTEAQGYLIEEGLEDGTISLDDIKKKIESKFSVVFLCDASDVTLKNIIDLTKKTESDWGRKIGLLIIDYLGLIGGVYGTSYEVITRVSRDIKTMAKKLNLAVLFLHHVSVKQKNIDEPVNLGDARDTSVAVDAVDFLIGMWRPSNDEIAMRLLKNRKGPANITQKFHFNLKNLIIKPKIEKETKND